MMPLFRAMDFYCGIGGWSAGLSLAGVDVIQSFDNWEPALLTYRKNLGKHARASDIRCLAINDLPSNANVVIGSPPCTEFSYSNRGGNGNYAEGLKDVEKFLEIVSAIQPRFWIMENVPRVANILEKELKSHGKLAHYRELVQAIEVFDMSDFGLPQRRRRCLAGNFPIEILKSYRHVTPRQNLGDVLSALEGKDCYDRLYGIKLDREEITDHEYEPPLTREEVRMNRDAKTHHPVYNDMRFPELLDSPARTVTATCTRVSRESLIVKHGTRRYRRLTLRERASIQGFPITFKFFAPSYTGKLKMIGNAVPPLFSYYVGCALQKIPASQLVHPCDISNLPTFASETPPYTPPTSVKEVYSSRRRFRAAIPNLRFKSGIRFEFANNFFDEEPLWRVEFRYGSPSDIRTLMLNGAVSSMLESFPSFLKASHWLKKHGKELVDSIDGISPNDLQNIWTRRSKGIHPYRIVDQLGALAKELAQHIERYRSENLFSMVLVLLHSDGQDQAGLANENKIRLHCSAIAAGIIVGCWFNGSAELVGRNPNFPVVDTYEKGRV